MSGKREKRCSNMAPATQSARQESMLRRGGEGGKRVGKSKEKRERVNKMRGLFNSIG